MISKRSEAAIKAWLKLPKGEKTIGVNFWRGVPTIFLNETSSEGLKNIARFTIASVVAKRLPRRKKAKSNK